MTSTEHRYDYTPTRRTTQGSCTDGVAVPPTPPAPGLTGSSSASSDTAPSSAKSNSARSLTAVAPASPRRGDAAGDRPLPHHSSSTRSTGDLQPATYRGGNETSPRLSTILPLATYSLSSSIHRLMSSSSPIVVHRLLRSATHSPFWRYSGAPEQRTRF
eukprot:8055945-Pyramimonas_sp.AAC.1